MTYKVLLIQPPESQCNFTRSGTILPPLGLAYVASSLRTHGIPVRILDGEGQGSNWLNIRHELLYYKPEIVGITCTSFTVRQAVQAAKIAKETVNATTVIGGPHASVDPISLVRDFDDVDVTVQNEGEITMVELVHSLETNSDLRNVNGITFKDQGQIVTNKTRAPLMNLDDLPLPAWDLLRSDVWKKYWDPRARRFPIATLQTNRGCPHQCIYCSEPNIYGRGVRFKGAVKVVDEIQYGIEKFGIKEFSVVDSIFTLWPKRVMEICDEILSRGLDIPWFCNSRVDTMEASLLCKMKKAGCHRVYFGVETGSEEMLKLSKKRATLSQAHKAVKLCKDYKMHVEAGFILGFPGEKMEHIRKSVELAQSLNADSTQFSILLPLPGTEVYNIVQENGVELPTYFDAGFNTPKVTVCNLSVDELVKTQRWAYGRVYLRLGYLMSQFIKIRPSTIKSDISRLMRFSKYMLRIK